MNRGHPPFLQTPCDLHAERGCVDAPETERVYRGAELALVHPDIPAAWVYDAHHDRFAWTTPTEVCWGRRKAEESCIRKP